MYNRQIGFSSVSVSLCDSGGAGGVDVVPCCLSSVALCGWTLALTAVALAPAAVGTQADGLATTGCCALQQDAGTCLCR